MASLAQKYKLRFGSVLVPIAERLQLLLNDHLKGLKHVDRISVRAKSPDRFLEKAAKTDKKGRKIYKDPLGQIQDQIGARVVVFYLDDVQPAADRVLRYCTHIEESFKEPASESEFGYFGRHLILSLPADCIPEELPTIDAPAVFELQVRTLFQHAWSEAEHDLAYKPKEPLTSDQKRRFAFTAAQAWGADKIFNELYQELGTKNARNKR